MTPTFNIREIPEEIAAAVDAARVPGLREVVVTSETSDLLGRARTAARVRTPEQADSWILHIMAAYAQLQLARPLAADLRRPWERKPDPTRPLPPGRARRGFSNTRRELGTPARVPKPSRPGPGRPKGTLTGPAPRYPLQNETRTTRKTDNPASREKVKT